MNQHGTRAPHRLLPATVALIAALIVVPAHAVERADAGPPAPTFAAAGTDPAPLVLDEELVWNRDMQTWGHALLGTGAVLIVTGAIMIEADNQGGVGKAGFSGIGAGLGVMTVGMFLLGFSRPVHLEEVPGVHVVATPAARGSGAVLTYDRYF